MADSEITTAVTAMGYRDVRPLSGHQGFSATKPDGILVRLAGAGMPREVLIAWARERMDCDG